MATVSGCLLESIVPKTIIINFIYFCINYTTYLHLLDQIDLENLYLNQRCSHFHAQHISVKNHTNLPKKITKKKVYLFQLFSIKLKPTLEFSYPSGFILGTR